MVKYKYAAPHENLDNPKNTMERKAMEAQRMPMSKPFTLEATAALIDLIRLSRRHGAAGEDMPHTIAVRLPERLLSFCGTEHRVLYVTTSYSPVSVQEKPCLKDRSAQSAAGAS